MDEEKTVSTESQAFGISIRGWVTLMVISTLCLISPFREKALDALVGMAGPIIAFYLGQKTSK